MMAKILKFIKEEKLIFIGVIVGLVGGYLYWRFVGCSSGNCPITSSPLLSSLWGAVMGGLLFGLFRKGKQ